MTARTPTAYTPEETAWLIEQIKLHTIEDGDCVLWQQCLVRCHPLKHLPKTWPTYRTINVRRFLMEAVWKRRKMGHTTANLIAGTSCGNPRCLCEDHATWFTKSEHNALVAKRTGYSKNPARSAKISASKLHTRKMTMHDVQAARLSDKSITMLAREHGVARVTMQRAIVGNSYKDYSSPWMQLMR